jgi:hypothetical protein
LIEKNEEFSQPGLLHTRPGIERTHWCGSENGGKKSAAEYDISLLFLEVLRGGEEEADTIQFTGYDFGRGKM